MSALETRSQAIVRHVQRALRETRVTLRSIADRMVDVYHARTALDERTVEFHTGTTADAYEAAARANAQLLKRMIDGQVRLPVDLEESLVLALPAEYQRSCLRDLADRYGLLAVERPSTDAVAQQTSIGVLMKETGELMVTLAPAFADGKLDEADADVANRALPEVLDLQARLAALASLLELTTRKPRQDAANQQRVTS